MEVAEIERENFDDDAIESNSEISDNENELSETVDPLESNEIQIHFKTEGDAPDSDPPMMNETATETQTPVLQRPTLIPLSDRKLGLNRKFVVEPIPSPKIQSKFPRLAKRMTERRLAAETNNVDRVTSFSAKNLHELSKDSPLKDTNNTKLLDLKPGSPAELALQVPLAKKKKIRVKKAVLKRLRPQNVPKDKEITKNHEHYHLTYGMMLGMRCSVGRGNPLRSNKLVVDNFMETIKLVFPPCGSGGEYPTPPHKLKHTFKFKDYAPSVFRQLRSRFGIGDADYMLSVCGEFNFIEFISNSKSGQFFFYSNDGNFMIKTQTKAESKFLRRILPHYYQYVINNPNTLMTRFYGMHRVKMKHLRKKMHFVVMQSVFAGDKEIHKTYDLKGSLKGRAAKPHEIEKGSGCVFKDLDLLKRVLPPPDGQGQQLKLGPRKRLLMSQLQNDCRFLQEMKIMDYSLLVGIHHRNRANIPGRRRKSVMVFPGQTVDSANNSPSIGPLPSPTTPTSNKQLQQQQSNHSFSPVPLSQVGNRSSRDLSEGEDFEDDGIVPAIRPHNPIWTQEDGGVYAVDSVTGGRTNEIYYMGIIDILQQYDLKKRAENFYKSIRHDARKISAVKPSQYADRFMEFMDMAMEG